MQSQTCQKGLLRIQAQGATIAVQSPIQLVLAEQCIAEIVMGFKMIRTSVDNLSKAFDGLVLKAELQQHNAAIVAGIQMIRV